MSEKMRKLLSKTENYLQYTCPYSDIIYCVETIDDSVENFKIEFSAWTSMGDKCEWEFFHTFEEFEEFCKEDGVDIDSFREYDPETDEYID